jgi:hypothetical protein
VAAIASTGFSIAFDDGPITALLNRHARAAVALALQQGEAVARALARVDTGRMRDAVASTVTSPDPLTVVGLLYDPVEYAIHNEFGTSRVSAQPFIRPGGDAAEASLAAAYAAVVGIG